MNILVLLTLIGLVSCSTNNHKIRHFDSKVLTGIWFLKAGAEGGGKSLSDPIGSTEVLGHLSKTGDTIIMISSDIALEGGIELKDGQNLIGLSESGRKPVITNSNLSRNRGCGIVLANNNRVFNLRIEETIASGIYGLNKSNVRIDAT